MPNRFIPVKLSGKTLKANGRPLDKGAAAKRVKSGKDVYSTKQQARALSKAIGGGRKIKSDSEEDQWIIKEIHSKNKGEIYFEHFHNPHRKERKKSGRKKMGHMFFGDGYEVK
ncbi:hypothetical protein [Tateyamaria sp. ANG-S1]|uniref:hypothetical protein n=1 Tax=Tateyamaria sp. ANG-S1 TaxID=1577905 RepID=UPI00126A70DA|nr:hypothetical protein [Tateyamaria sp. ANG-S1]